LISPSKTLSRTKWRSISTCFVLWCCTGLLAVYTRSHYHSRQWKILAVEDSVHEVAVVGSQLTSATSFATPLYSASALDRDNVLSFRGPGTKLLPKNTQYPEVERRVSGQPTQSASE
jgi:hypothetical protein